MSKRSSKNDAWSSSLRSSSSTSARNQSTLPTIVGDSFRSYRTASADGHASVKRAATPPPPVSPETTTENGFHGARLEAMSSLGSSFDDEDDHEVPSSNISPFAPRYLTYNHQPSRTPAGKGDGKGDEAASNPESSNTDIETGGGDGGECEVHLDEIHITGLSHPAFASFRGDGDDDLTEDEFILDDTESPLDEEYVDDKDRSEEEQAGQSSRTFRVVRVRKRRTFLFGSADRGDHLRRLFLKRKIRSRLFRSYGAKGTTTPTPTSIRKMMNHSCRTDSSAADRQEDSSFYRGLKAEVEKEMEVEQLPAKIMEVERLWRTYTDVLNLNSVEYPLEVRMKQVSYTVPVETNLTIRTVYNTSPLYPVYKLWKRLLRGEPRKRRQFQSKKVLNDISLVLKPGRMYLVLGPPSSGKTSLLRAISGLIRPVGDELLEGSISYNGRTLEESDEFHIENMFGYIDQLDQHAARLTVGETFDFAYQCKSGGRLLRDETMVATKEAEEALKRINKEKLATQITLASLGLSEVRNTFVGDTNVRGVSGGQRRRVTVGEMLMSRTPVLCGDEISTGLDAASTYDMVQLILHFGRLRKLTRIFALLQPSPETVSLFDDIILLAEGQIIYLGPVELVQAYFAEIGFRAPQFADVADFLQVVATEDGAQFYDPPEAMKAARPVAPTIAEMADIFRQSHLGRKLQQELACPPSYVWREEDSTHAVPVSNVSIASGVKKKYANHFPRSMYLILVRFLTLWTRDKRVIIAGAVKNIAMGLSCGGVFASTTDVASLQGALFQAGLFIMLGSMQSSSGLLQDRVIFYKHADANFYSAWPFVFGRTIAGLPQTTMDTVTFGTILYYMVGFAGREDPLNFLTYLCLLLAFAILMNQQMAVFASFADSSTVQVYAACTILFMMLFCGFIAAPDTIPGYFWWAYWWNPFAWAYRALVVNEFRSARWDNPDRTLKSVGFTEPSGDAFQQEWVLYGFYFMVLYFFVCCVGTAVGLSFSRSGSAAPVTYSQKKQERSRSVNTEHETAEIPFKQVTLSFHNICYEVQSSTSKEKLSLLKGVSGIFRGGRMTALMGSSGAGKTTLLDVIALRKRRGTVAGEVRLNGWLQEPVSFRRCSGYVEQFDVQSPELTVRETIIFAARLRLGPEDVSSDEQTQAFADHIMAQVELSELADSLVGTHGVGLSFGQRKLLSIAVELAASPSVIFLDEPTSGLDSRSALMVVKTLRRVADSGRAICATIHQPSSAIFAMFDELLLLRKGGEVVYSGLLGENCEHLVAYFESRGAPKINFGENPANWMLRVITSESMGGLAELYRSSREYEVLKEELRELKNCPEESTQILYDSWFAVSWGRRQELVNHRLRTIYWRSPAYNLSRVLVSLVIAIILGSMFLTKYGQERFKESEMRARLSVIFLTFIIVGIMAIISVLPVMTRIRDMYYRHSDAGMYESESMGLALGVAEKWFIVLSSALFCIVFLSVSDLTNSVGGMISFWAFFTFNFAIYSYFGQCFVCLVKPMETALILCSVFIGLNNFFSGLIVRPQFMVGSFFVLPYYLTPGHYVYEGMVSSIFLDDNRTVVAEEGSEFYSYLLENDVCSEESMNPCNGTVVQYIDSFYGGQFQEKNNARNCIILGFVLTMTRVLTWLALKYIRFGS